MKIFAWDIPILILLGFAYALLYAKVLRDKHPDSYFHMAAVTVLIFWVNSLIALFGAYPWGAHWAIRVVPKAIAFFYVLSYPLWLIWGGARAFHLFGRSPRQGGLMWIFSLKDRTKPFKKPWDQGEDRPDK